MFNKKLKEELQQCQSNLGAALVQVNELFLSSNHTDREVERYRRLYDDKQRQANSLANQMLNFFWGLTRHEATLQCSKSPYESSACFQISFKPHLHFPGNIHSTLQPDEETLNLLENLMQSIGVKGWEWVKETASLTRTYFGSEKVPNALADMEKAEAELQALLDEAVRVNKIKAAFEPVKVEEDKG